MYLLLFCLYFNIKYDTIELGETMNIIFLDIDGVLNTSDSFKEEYYKSKELNRIRIYPIDEDRLSYLVEIVKLTNAKIVLTSSNRVNFIKIDNKLIPLNNIGKDILNIFSKHNLSIYDITPYDDNRLRGNEIKMWLENNKNIDNYIIIDDEEVGLELYKDKLIKTNINNEVYGLNIRHVNKAVKKLKKL